MNYKRRFEPGKYPKKCTLCGKDFVSAGRFAKYCAACKKIGYKMQDKKRAVSMQNDTEAMRQACLNCVKPNCTGSCRRLVLISKGEATCDMQVC